MLQFQLATAAVGNTPCGGARSMNEVNARILSERTLYEELA